MRSGFLKLTGGVTSAILLAFLFGCATPSPPLPPSLNLPQPVTDLKAVRKGDKVLLSWTVPIQTTDDALIREVGPTLICRSEYTHPGDPLPPCKNPVGEIPTPRPLVVSKDAKGAPPRQAANYTDTLPPTFSPDPAKSLVYTVEVLNANRRSGGSSNTASVLAALTLPPPQDLHPELMPAGVSLVWHGLSTPAVVSGVSYRYRVFRKQEGSTNDVFVGEAIVRQGSFGLLDTNFEWEKTYTYRIIVATVLDSGASVEGSDSPEVRIVAHDVFPPQTPVELQAVFSGPGQKPFVDLTWTANTEADLAGYNVYRREADGTPAKLNDDLVKTPSFRDETPVSGRTYLYSVSAVDLRGNESGRSAETRESIP